MFKIVVKNTEGKSTNFVCKRIAPKELPDKKDPEIWKQFLRSVRREIQFYQMLKIDLASASDGDDGVSRLFPRVLHCSSTEPSMDDTEYAQYFCFPTFPALKSILFITYYVLQQMGPDSTFDLTNK